MVTEPSVETFELTAEPGRTVEVLGDFPSWKHPLRLPEVAPGRYRLEKALAPGVYRARLRLDGRTWLADPGAAAIDRAEGYENGLRLVGGTAPPLLFAPDRRHIAHLPGGKIIVHVEHLGPGDPPRAFWVEAGGTRREAPLVEVLRRGELRCLRATLTLPEAAAAPPGGVLGFAGRWPESFALPPVREPLGAPPRWLAGAVFYAIFVDRWHRSAGAAPDSRAAPRTAPSGPHTFYGGDLDGITAWLDHFTDLGITALLLTPVHVSATPHRYDGADLLAVDPRLGGEPALARLVAAAHARGLRVVLDAAFTHVAAGHPAFADLLARQADSPYAGWFQVRRFPVVAGDGASYAHYPGRPELPLLALGPGPARAHVIAAAERMVMAGVDGLRLDAMEEVPADFWAELRAATRARNPELLLLGEVVSDRPHLLAETRGADVVTDFPHRTAVLDFFAHGQIDAAEFWARVALSAHRMGPFEPGFRLLFLDNHDTARFRSIAIQHDRLRLALVWLLVQTESVALTYGTEAGLAGGATDARLEDVWADRLPMPGREALNTRTRQLIHRSRQGRAGGGFRR